MASLVLRRSLQRANLSYMRWSGIEPFSPLRGRQSWLLCLAHETPAVRCGHAGISTGKGYSNYDDPVRPYEYNRARTRLQKTQDSLDKTRATIRKTKGQVSAHVKETTKIVSERMGNLRENVLTIPNALSFFRMCSTPVLGYLVVTSSYTPALVLFCISGITDVLDGQIARAFPSQQSMLGTLLDPMADKFLVATLFLTLTVAGLIPVPLTALIITRDAIIVGCGLYIRFQSLPPPKTFHRYFDVTLATVKFSPTALSKMNTAIQLGLVAATLAAPVFGYVDHYALHCLWYLTAGTTLTSGLMYLFTKDSYRYIRKKI